MPTAAEVFVNALNRQTGIAPSVLNYWINAEGDYAPRGTGGFNFLNMRPDPYHDDRFTSLSPGKFEQFNTLQAAIDATVHRLREPFMNALMSVVKAGGTPEQQWQAIGKTGWDIGNYSGSSFDPNVTINYPGPTVSGTGGGAAGGASTVAATAPAFPNAAISFARNALGTPYVWGGESASGYDCSGLVQAAMLKAGVTGIGRTTFDQWYQGTAVPQGQLQPGDVVFYKGSDSRVVNGKLEPGHEALYIGNGKIIQAPGHGGQVEISNLNSIGSYMGARRFTQSAGQGAAVATGASTQVGSKAQPQATGVATGTGNGGVSEGPHLVDPGAALMRSLMAGPLLAPIDAAKSSPLQAPPPQLTRPIGAAAIPPNPTSYLPTTPTALPPPPTNQLPPTFPDYTPPSFLPQSTQSTLPQSAPPQLTVPLLGAPPTTSPPLTFTPPAFVSALAGR